jgi:predicted nucleic acid-binding protein
MILLDTSGLLCCYHAGEPQHADAVTFFNAATARLTHSYVLAEFVALCQARRLNRTRVLNFSVDLLDNPHVEIVWVDEALHRSALTLLQERLDKAYSLCDAVSFVLMRDYGITEALTTDRHYEQERFIRLLRP